MIPAANGILRQGFGSPVATPTQQYYYWLHY
jgi:hypothetical protein